MINPRKGLVRNIQDLLELLWGFDNRIDRHLWQDALFRVICQRACELINKHCGIQGSRDFHELVGRYFIATHWLVPYPTPTKFVQRNKYKRPLWIRFYH